MWCESQPFRGRLYLRTSWLAVQCDLIIIGSGDMLGYAIGQSNHNFYSTSDISWGAGALVSPFDVVPPGPNPVT